jgi:hypothetical protein
MQVEIHFQPGTTTTTTTAIGLSLGGSSPTLVQTRINITQNNYKNTHARARS